MRSISSSHKVEQRRLRNARRYARDGLRSAARIIERNTTSLLRPRSRALRSLLRHWRSFSEHFSPFRKTFISRSILFQTGGRKSAFSGWCQFKSAKPKRWNFTRANVVELIDERVVVIGAGCISPAQSQLTSCQNHYQSALFPASTGSVFSLLFARELESRTRKTTRCDYTSKKTPAQRDTECSAIWPTAAYCKLTARHHNWGGGGGWQYRACGACFDLLRTLQLH